MQYWCNLSILICFLVVTCSCNNSSRTARRLFVADSLANENMIDSTISILNDIKYSELNDWNKHYYDLLIILKSATIIQYTIKGRFMSR